MLGPRASSSASWRPELSLHSPSADPLGRREREIAFRPPGLCWPDSRDKQWSVPIGGAMIEPLTTFGDFQLVRQLGQPGGFGAAYEAIHTGERCVVKIFHDELVDRVALARFQREVMAQKRCSHPNLVRYLDSGLTTWQGRRCHWISMPYLAGRTLREELAIRGGSLSAERAISVARQVAAGLVALHAEGIVHRDLKPSNVFLCDDGTVIVLDFGIALFLDYTSLTERGAFIGTYGYAAPEQLEGEEVPATDLYSLGAVLYHVITGRLPFRARGHLRAD